MDWQAQLITISCKRLIQLFKHAHINEFKGIDGLIRRRLRAVLLRRNKRDGWGKSVQAHKRWRNVYFAKIGLFTMYETRLSLCQSR